MMMLTIQSKFLRAAAASLAFMLLHVAGCVTSPIPTPGNVPAGKTVFDDNGCSVCHGADGSGTTGPNIRQESAASLSSTLAAGTDHSGGARPDLTSTDLTDLAAFLSSNDVDSNGNVNGNDNGDASSNGSSNDPDTGLTLFGANGCSVCHGADGSGGSGSNIRGEDSGELAETLAAGTNHPGGAFPNLTSADLNDIAAFLGGGDDSDDEGDDQEGDDDSDDDANSNGSDSDDDTNTNGGGTDNTGGLTGDPTAGGSTFAANNCSLCHGADGSGASARNILGTSASDLTVKLGTGGGHPGGAFPDLTEQDLADVTAFLTP